MLCISVFLCLSSVMFTKAYDYDDFQEIKIYFDLYNYTSTLPKIYEGKLGNIQYEEASDILIFNCDGPKDLSAIVDRPFNNTINASQICINNCALPLKPLVEVFYNINVNVDGIKDLIIRSLTQDSFPPSNYTAGLNVKTLWIETPYITVNARDVFIHNTNFMEPLTNLKALILTGSVTPPLPNDMRLEVLSVESNAKVTSWQRYCRDLRKLSIRKMTLGDIPKVWPDNCSQLTVLRLKGLYWADTKLVVESGINASCTNLQSLCIYASNMNLLPMEILNVAKDLKILNMSMNRLTDNSMVPFPYLANLTHLDLSKNLLTGWVLFEIAHKMPSLRELKLDGNNFLNLFCNYESKLNYFTMHMNSLEKLSLNQMSMNTDCFENVRFSKLKYLSMASSGAISSFYLKKLPKTNASTLLVDIRGRTIKYFEFSYHDYKPFLAGNPAGYWGSDEKTKLTVLIDSVNCDCDNYFLTLAIRNLKNFVNFPGLRCSNSQRKITEEPMRNIYCSISSYRHGCFTRSDLSTTIVPSRRDIRIDCHNQKTEIMMLPIVKQQQGIHEVQTKSYTSINLTDNVIENLNIILDNIPKSVKWLDLRRNKISRLKENEIKRLFANENMSIWLSENLLVCDCENAVTIDALHLHRNQIPDFEEITCLNTGRSLNLTSSYEVCEYGVRNTRIAGAVIAVALLIGVLWLWRYRLQIKIYLYSRGLCLFCLSEDDVDADRPYDAFLSFSHGDEEYVLQELLPKLESKPYNYRICVHYRDWVVGDWIPTQIMRSVSQSKRTIIVLSRNFIDSMWGSLEFRYAVASAAQENRTRLLVLVLDDVISDDLDAELKGYLAYNTYLRCDDPWFWEKLRYSMPRCKRLSEDNDVIISEERPVPYNTSEANRLNEIHMLSGEVVGMSNLGYER